MIKVKIKETDEKNEFPALYIHTDGGLIVLFTGETTGTALLCGADNEIGEGGDWCPCSDRKEWLPFHGSITLTQ